MAFALSVGSMSPLAYAAPPEAADGLAEAANDGDFRRGLALFEQREFAGAIVVWEKLRADLGEARGFRVLYNLGLAYDASGDPTRAVERFEAFNRHLSEQPTALTQDLEDRRQDAVEKVRAIRASRGAVHLTSTVVAAVTVDHEAPRVAGFTAYLPTGDHVVVGEGQGRRAKRVVVHAQAGVAEEVDVTPELDPPPPVLAPRPEAPPPRAVEPPRFPFLAVGIGVAATGLSFALPIALRGHAADARATAAALGAGQTDYADALGVYEGARTRYYASFALPAALGAITAGVAIVGGLRSGAFQATGPRTARGLDACGCVRF